MSAVARRPANAPRPARPAARYWRGKAPKGVAELSESDEEDEVGEVEEQAEDEAVDIPLGAVEASDEEEDDEEEEGNQHRAKPKATLGKMNIALRDVEVKEGKVIVAGREESGKTAMEESEEESEEEDEKVAVPSADAEEEESSEYESSSEEEEEPPKPIFRPVFVPKRGRVTVLEREQEAQDSEEALERKKLEEEERRKQSHDLVAESIKRELAEKEREKEVPDIDDTDGVDPDGEFEAWRLRELSRIKRDKEAQAARELEREEIERRRALPEEQRMKEDLEHAKATRDLKSKGQQQFLQKYWHKGAFHQDDEVLKRHDYTEATESAVDVSLLPNVMQVRDFGKRSRTKWTHLVNEDTTVGTGGFGGVGLKPGAGKPGEPGSGCFNCGGPHLKKDCPHNSGPPGTGANNANGTHLTRSWGQDSRRDNDRSWKDRDRGGRSPPRRRDYGDREREYDRYKSRNDDYRDRQRDDKYYDRPRDSRYKDRDASDRHLRRSRSRSPVGRNGDRDHRERPRNRSRDRSLEDSRRGKRIRTD
ncbi:uncharacterized protein FOMMEDRAFT_167614 [Fomitiporia mediterranea MF3/22]|uniref:uncharacterized protein n=1 Tax=Fomitiporia mediterranea (strain MF3/22) TaxID=694068 RepID=UPI000440973E|nr:uncharacterized protein FOMMEDRAFT_167614 [Fomitiporia mediterranea MF3/22]EJD04425.1 hypothetical protein FOMMEDRAFT_167614 [Fomitiporia mediterranea MF3/22]